MQKYAVILHTFFASTLFMQSVHFHVGAEQITSGKYLTTSHARRVGALPDLGIPIGPARFYNKARQPIVHRLR